MERLTGILGVVCRRCDAYNDPCSRTCIACGGSLAADPSTEKAPSAAPGPAPPPQAASRSASPPAGEMSVSEAARPDPSIIPPAGPPSKPPVPLPSSSGRVSSPPPLGAGATRLAAARAPAIAARLVVLRGEAPLGTVFHLGHDEVQAGRSQGQVLFPDDPCLAQLHATFLVREQTLLVRDEGAAGGVYVRLSEPVAPLRPGSLFAVGDRLLRFAGPLPPPPPAPGDGTHRLGSPRPERAVLVEEWLEGGLVGRAYLRTGPSITIGRAGCSINLGDDPYVSQAHAEIVVETDSATLRDLGSSNGTFVRIPPGGERELRDGEALRIGREVLRVEAGPGPAV